MENNNYLVSIIVPVYNAEKWIKEALDSALNQTWANIEIIVINDGSVDNSFVIAQTFVSSRVKVISQENRGASAARNRGLSEAKGDFIQFLDADDLLAPDKIELQIKLLSTEKNKYCIASGEWARFYKSPSEAKFIYQPLWKDMSPVDWLVCAWQEHWMMHPGSWLIPRDIVLKAGLWDESLSLNDDGEYFCRVILASKGIKFCPKVRSYYRSGLPKALSARKDTNALDSLYRSYEKNVNNLLLINSSEKTKMACATVFKRFIYEVYPLVPNLRKQAQEKVLQLGGSGIKPSGGPLFKALSFILGWRLTRRMQHLFCKQ